MSKDLSTTLGKSLLTPTGHTLTTLYYKGQPCWIAQEIGVALGYSQGGSRLVTKLAGDWSSEAIKGEDFFKIEDEELADLKTALVPLGTESVRSGEQLTPGSGVSQVGSRSHNLLLTERGVWLACIKSNKPAGVELRRWLTSEVLPALRQTEAYTTAAVSSEPSSREAKRLTAGKTRLSVDVPEELAEELRTICYWRGAQLARTVSDVLGAWVQEMRAAQDFMIDPETRRPIEKPAGDPYPERTGELKLGRPAGS